MALSPTVRGVLLFVVCFASTGTAPLPRNNNVNAYASVLNNKGNKMSETILPWKAIFSYRSPWPKRNVTTALLDGKPMKAMQSKDMSHFAGQLNGRDIFDGRKGKGSHACCTRKKDTNVNRFIARRRVTRRVSHDHHNGQRWSHIPITINRPGSFSSQVSPFTILYVIFGIFAFIVIFVVFVVLLDKYCGKNDDLASTAATPRNTVRSPPPEVSTVPGSSHLQPSAFASRMSASLRRHEEEQIRAAHPLVYSVRTDSQNTTDVSSWLERTVTPGSLDTASAPTGPNVVGGPQTSNTRIFSSSETGRYPPPEVGTTSVSQPSAFAARMRNSLRRDEESRIGIPSATDVHVSSERTTSRTPRDLPTPLVPAESSMLRGPQAPNTRSQLSVISEDSDLFVQFSNPLAVEDREPRSSSREATSTTSVGDSSSSSGSRTGRPAPGSGGRRGDRPPDYAEVVMADLISLSGAEFGTARSTYDQVLLGPEQQPPPCYDDVRFQADGDLAPPP